MSISLRFQTGVGALMFGASRCRPGELAADAVRQASVVGRPAAVHDALELEAKA